MPRANAVVNNGAPNQPPGPSQPSQPSQPGVAPQAPTPGIPAQAPPPWASDPILAQAQASYQQAMASSEAQSAARQQQLLTAYGDPELARMMLGADSPYATAAEQNPFSTLANLRYGYGQSQNQLINNLSPNLFYSSTRARAQEDQTRDYQGQLYGAAGEAQAGLSEIQEALLEQRMSSEDSLRAAQEDAYERWLARSLAGGGLPRTRGTN